MKKVWLVIVVLCVMTTASKAGWSFDPSGERWVDSIYQKLTVDERVGQLLDLKISPKKDNVDSLFNVLTKHHIGAVTITGGDVTASVELINQLQYMLKVPVFVSIDNQNSLSLPFESAAQMPEASTYACADDHDLLQASLKEIASISHEIGISATSFNPYSLDFSEDGIHLIEHPFALNSSLFKDIPTSYFENGIVASTDFSFEFNDDFAFSPKLLPSWNTSTWKENIKSIEAGWKNLNIPYSIIKIKSLPEFPEHEAVYFNKKIINPLFWKHLQFEGILSSDFDQIKQSHIVNSDAETIRTLLKIGSDKIVVSSDVDKAFNSIMTGLDERYLRSNEIKDKVKRLLSLKYKSGLAKPKYISTNHLHSKIHNPELNKLSYQVYTKAVSINKNGKNLMPFYDLERTNFASLVLGYSESRSFQETLGKYAPFVHYMLPDIAFDPYDFTVLSGQLAQFDNVIVGLHSRDLKELDTSVIDFLTQLSEHTNLILVCTGNSINPHELDSFENVLFVHEDNLYTQQIAAQQIFGAQSGDTSVGRLAYAIPEMHGMDSKVLQKIDKIVEEAISMSATPGCQILVARNGSVVMEKGYGYYTYDSIMPVDTRTIYDLASITKVAATTQAVMKLKEQGKICLDSTMGDYLPELKGSNKASLVIRDVLAHQSGLRAFYPFWRNTIEDEDQILHYYADKPNETYHNTVAYGMFAAEDLKDSLWHWTIETQLRRKRDKYEPYDYRYSDLGFYLLQMLVERVSEKSLDAYVDSVFYNSMGMSTLSFNPLCKYPLKRITPTERDTEFRHVLVWGTVHDQIAAMKGGVSGHAGLFGNAHDIAKVLQMHLQDGSYGGKQYLAKKTVEEFRIQQNNNSRRGLGWDKPEKGDDYNPASRYASFDSFGHSGFTGTIAWADPTFNLIFVFLSNRIYPDMNNGKLIDFNIRKRIQDVVYESMWNYEKRYN